MRSSAARRAAARGARACGEVAAAVEAVFEGARRAGGGVNEEMPESRAGSLWSGLWASLWSGTWARR